MSTATLPWHQRLSRQARDDLFLLAVLTILVMQMSRVLPIWTAIFALLLLGWRISLTVRSKALPKRWQLVVLLLLSAAGVAFELVANASISGAALTMLLLLLVLKTLEMQARRDSFVLFFLGFFCIVTTFLFAQSMLVALLMVVVFCGLLTALVNAHKPVGRPPLWESAKSALLLLGIGLPLIATLYLVFPRFAPLWGVPNAPTQGRTGLSGTMEVGTIADLAQSRAIALRVRFDEDSPVPEQSQMYFRGPVLSRIQGRSWQALNAGPVNAKAPAGSYSNPFVPQGQPVRYESVVEAHGQRWLLPLDWMPTAPEQAADMPASSMLNQELVWNSYRPLNSAKRYQTTSYLQGQYAQAAQAQELAPYLQLPESDNPRTRTWATQLRANIEADAQIPASQRDRALVEHVLQLLRQDNYSYTLQPPLYSEDTADDFWFVHRSGFCEHIASAYAVLMRAAGIPARIVTGYQGGEINPVDGVLIVRQSDAHAWVEVWLPREGWVRIDPTGAIAPQRINLTQTAALQSSGSDARAAAWGNDMPWLTRLQAIQDAMDYRWTQWVLNYDQRSQQSLLESLGLQRLNWLQLATLSVVLVLATGLLYLVWPYWRRQARDPWAQLLTLTQTRLQQQGLQLPAHTPPARMAQAAEGFFGPHAAADVSQWLLAMDALRYARHSPETLPELKRRWRRLSWPSKPQT
ncbi:DUF3488 and transglutaminase-like domain-containing protein [Lampropedia aestuarii]|uniref:transglutaminase family protein n=1 Tax=Lampropedia aestuarii TaxID=2562762 RepID=UPI002469513F|nr:DUF3488 and transglutaminase-like domain-containing protein [Lampropedia aestuarii]MDH5858087.1 DUF3488 and transglutaminase-like domain-containing protein [Lampropedia aestuarii]